ncbi:polyhydroxyalkanoate synthesis repressor PhaR [Siculibacillus lacustris]|uniref:Polyhydroxyalkanoate synthesis repressor PhaR n=1 Tax=Siculibacillus lacustris TaxID=1549641 RepID=A0A4Q9VXD0_9HYPH|nr:polyhydroxyalkanoate synthesis repressor PhaR [Siculibacillus lacustris]TBW39977.1 polyhydroxyalkanoate synthesis repressor PhaR [Siculibacillus lacustris]
MAKTTEPTIIKKYANRRLYNTGTSSYVTLEDLAEMVKREEIFVVYDAKSGDDITRSVLTQIIFEQEGKGGQNLLPIAFLRQLIGFYGDSMQKLVPSYLEFSIDSLTREQGKFREQMASAFPGNALEAMEEQVRRNSELFERTMRMFSPFAAIIPETGAAAAPAAADPAPSELDLLKQQMDEMKKQLDAITAVKS